MLAGRHNILNLSCGSRAASAPVLVARHSVSVLALPAVESGLLWPNGLAVCKQS